jgi:NADPH:quinone reductase-like Zn-dependent oxidoreductase
MKAAVYHRYGPPDVVQIGDVEKPVPKDNEVLIEVRAASANPLDWHFVRGKPNVVRIVAGLRRPKFTQLGVDVSGQVEAVGKNVAQFKPGDEVFGTCRGAFAEYVCAPEAALVMKPRNLTFEQATSAPVAAFSALQGLRDAGKIQPGQKVLINGAAGGVGTFAVQIAKSFGANVTGVCSTRNLDMVRSIGADCVIDYSREDFTQSAQRFDVILDCVGNRSLSECRRVLVPKGIHVPVGGSGDQLFVSLIGKFALSLFVSQKLVMFFLAKPNKEDLTIICELMATGKVTPVIDKRYKLSEVPEALAYLEQGHARGKVIISFANERQTSTAAQTCR